MKFFSLPAKEGFRVASAMLTYAVQRGSAYSLHIKKTLSLSPRLLTSLASFGDSPRSCGQCMPLRSQSEERLHATSH